MSLQFHVELFTSEALFVHKLLISESLEAILQFYANLSDAYKGHLKNSGNVKIHLVYLHFLRAVLFVFDLYFSGSFGTELNQAEFS